MNIHFRFIHTNMFEVFFALRDTAIHKYSVSETADCGLH